MRCLVQRVLSASVSVSGETLGSVEKGYMILLGVKNTDSETVADKMVKKVLDARLFEDENGKTNLSIRDISGSILVVSLRFTPTPKEAIVQASLMPATLPTQKNSTSISCRESEKKAFLCNMENSVPICRFSLSTTDRSRFCMIATRCKERTGL